MYKDIERIRNSYNYFYQEELINKIEKDITSLLYMPRIHKTLISSNDKNGEYRRMISGKYIIIYKIVKDEIIILRIFNQKENYLNQKGFILKEESESYIVNRRRKINMIKLKTLKNTYSKLKKNYTHIITEDEAMLRYMNLLIDEAEENLRNGGGTISLEEWHEHMRREYNIVLS